MFGKVKKWLGIEGVKLEIILPEVIDLNEGAIKGALRFYSLHPQVVTSVRVVMIEKYARGRGKSKLVDEYLLGEIELNEPFEVAAEETLEMAFELPFERLNSEMDDIGNKNFLLGGAIKVAKSLKNVHSEYRIEAEAQAQGTKLNPFDKKILAV